MSVDYRRFNWLPYILAGATLGPLGVQLVWMYNDGWDVVWNSYRAMFDADVLAITSLYMVGTFLSMVAGVMPTTAHDALTAASAEITGTKGVLSVQCGVWLLDQFVVADVAVPLFIAGLLWWFGMVVLRFVVYIVGRVWGSAN